MHYLSTYLTVGTVVTVVSSDKYQATFKIYIYIFLLSVLLEEQLNAFNNQCDVLRAAFCNFCKVFFKHKVHFNIQKISVRSQMACLTIPKILPGYRQASFLGLFPRSQQMCLTIYCPSSLLMKIVRQHCLQGSLFSLGENESTPVNFDF